MYGVRCDISNSLERTRNSVVTAVTSHFGATASHYHKQELSVTPSAKISKPKKSTYFCRAIIKSLQYDIALTRTSIWFDLADIDPTLILDDGRKW